MYAIIFTVFLLLFLAISAYFIALVVIIFYNIISHVSRRSSVDEARHIHIT